MEEDEDILNHVKIYGERQWGLAIKLIESGRGRSNLRHRYRTLKKFMKKFPGKELGDAPRRRMTVKRKEEKRKDHITALVLERLHQENKIPDLETVEKYRQEAQARKTLDRMTERGIDSDDEALIEYFQIETLKRAAPVQGAAPAEDAAADVEKLLDVLGADLALPSEAEILSVATLDEHDKRILCGLKRREAQRRPDGPNDPDGGPNDPKGGVSHLMPPSATTMLAFRNLIMDMNNFKARYERVNAEPKFSPPSPACELFRQRFDSLMKWPALMAVTDLPETAVAELKTPDVKEAAERRPGRPAKKDKYWKVERMQTKRWEERQLEGGAEDEPEPEAEPELEVNRRAGAAETAAAPKPLRTYGRKKPVAETGVRFPVASTSFAVPKESACVESSVAADAAAQCAERPSVVESSAGSAVEAAAKEDRIDLLFPGQAKEQESDARGRRSSKRFKKC